MGSEAQNDMPTTTTTTTNRDETDSGKRAKATTSLSMMRCLPHSLSLCFSFTLPLYDLPFFLHLLSLFILCASSAALAEKPKTKKKQNWKWQQSRSSDDSSRGSGGSSTVDVRSISFWLMCFLLSQRQRRCCCDWQRCVFLPTYAFTFCVCIIIPNCVCSTHSLTLNSLSLHSAVHSLHSRSPDSLKESHAQNKNKRNTRIRYFCNNK